MNPTKSHALAALDEMRPQLSELCTAIHELAELGFKEYRSSELLCHFLQSQGMRVQRGCGGLETAFRAEFGTGGPVIGLICEYDALPNLGHACGHNMIGTASAGAGAAAAKAMGGLPGKIVVIGTPAEELSGGGKEILAQAGVMDDLDCAMMFHPGNGTGLVEGYLAIQMVKIRFHGKPSHAGAAPHEGISALEAIIQFFVNINGMRAHLTSDVRIHGIITNGGTVCNVIPELCEAEIGVRARTTASLEDVLQRLFACARAAAMATDCTEEIERVGVMYKDFVPNHALAEVLCGNMQELGLKVDVKFSDSAVASTDMANLSHYVPAIHPIFGVGNEATLHSAEFTELCAGQRGADIAFTCARALALTTLDLLESPALLVGIKNEFDSRRAAT